jgi:hypothetical protein
MSKEAKAQVSSEERQEMPINDSLRELLMKVDVVVETSCLFRKVNWCRQGRNSSSSQAQPKKVISEEGNSASMAHCLRRVELDRVPLLSFFSSGFDVSVRMTCGERVDQSFWISFCLCNQLGCPILVIFHFPSDDKDGIFLSN